MRASGTTGQHWEIFAADFLRRNGLKILELRYRCRLGEIDLVCADGAALVIVEVRARRSTSFAQASATIDLRKRRKLSRSARHYLMQHPQWIDAQIRFDVVAIDDIDSETPRVQWLRNAFDGDGCV